MGTKDGSIIAAIITVHMPRNNAAAPGHVWPGIRIHAIDIVQPPGIVISPIVAMDAHQTIVTAALAAKSSAETPKNACCEIRSEAMLGTKLVLVQIVLFQELRPEILWRSGNVRPTLWREVHEIPIRPHRVDMIPRQFSSPEMKDFSVP